MNYYPIAVRLKGKRVVVAGGGNVAERKVLGLLKADARVRVISPELTTRLAALAKKKKISWVRDTVRPRDLRGADIVIAATSDRGVNRKVSDWSLKAGKLINAVDDKTLGNFISPAVIRKQKAIIAIYTDGVEPELSRDLKNFIGDRWDEFLSFRNRP